MNILIMVQVVAFVAFIVFVLDSVVKAVTKRLFPDWSRGVCTLVTAFLVTMVMVSTVPGRTRHLEYVKQSVVDEVAAKNFNAGGRIGNWLGSKITSLTVDIILQGMRVEKYLGLVSIGYVETDAGWTPVSVGFAGIVCRNFFIVVQTYQKPPVVATREKDAQGNDQIVLSNFGDVKFECMVFPQLNAEESPLCKFDLDGRSSVRIQQEKKGLGNKLKRLMSGDKSIVTISLPLSYARYIMFKDGRRLMKRAELRQVNGELKMFWADPK